MLKNAIDANNADSSN